MPVKKVADSNSNQVQTTKSTERKAYQHLFQDNKRL